MKELKKIEFRRDLRGFKLFSHVLNHSFGFVEKRFPSEDVVLMDPEAAAQRLQAEPQAPAQVKAMIEERKECGTQDRTISIHLTSIEFFFFFFFFLFFFRDVF